MARARLKENKGRHLLAEAAGRLKGMGANKREAIKAFYRV